MRRLVTGVLILGLSAPSFAMGRKPAPSSALADQITKSYSARAEDGLLSGASIGVFDSQNTNEPLKLTFGEAKTSQDRFEIGSISKSFTGILLSKLILEGKISLDAPIEDVIPELKGTFVGSVSAHLLATHSARLVDDASGDFQFTDTDLVTYLKGYSPGEDRPAGERHYSNIGFMTLSLLMSRATGNRFVDLVRNQIFKSLHMFGSGYLNNKNVFGSILQPHTALLEDTSYDLLLDVADGAGGVYSNLDDMSKFLRANLDPQSAPSLTEAIVFSQILGLGWDSAPDASVIWKNGAMTGFGSIIKMNPATHTGVIVLCNSRCTSSATTLALIAMGGVDHFMADLPMSGEARASVVGTYFDSNGKDLIDVVVNSERFLGLHLRETGDPDFYSLRLRKQGENKFSVYDGLGETADDFVQFGSDLATGKKQLHYFEWNSQNAHGNPIFTETVFTQK